MGEKLEPLHGILSSSVDLAFICAARFIFKEMITARVPTSFLSVSEEIRDPTWSIGEIFCNSACAVSSIISHGFFCRNSPTMGPGTRYLGFTPRPIFLHDSSIGALSSSSCLDFSHKCGFHPLLSFFLLDRSLSSISSKTSLSNSSLNPPRSGGMCCICTLGAP